VRCGHPGGTADAFFPGMVRDVLRKGNAKKTGGLLLVVLGAFVLVEAGVRYTMEDAGVRMPVGPLVGVLLIAAGAALLFIRRPRL
jgi:hypothetical protein